MPSPNSMLRSVSSEERWTTEMFLSFPAEEEGVHINLNIPPCVFRVPTSFVETKPEAYVPRLVGLGPYHHLRPDLYTAQRRKLAVVAKLHPRINLRAIAEGIAKWEPFIRQCYDEYLDFDPQTLAWIFAVDAFYLNQIPSLIIAGIFYHLVASGDDEVRRLLQLESFRGFCYDASPLPVPLLGILEPAEAMIEGHLLKLMYHLIVKDCTAITSDHCNKLILDNPALILAENLKRGVDAAAGVGVPGAGIVQQLVSLAEKVPWDSILSLFKKGDPDGKSPSLLVEEIDIPCVSQLVNLAGIRFSVVPEGIRGFKYDAEEKKFYLPVIKIKSNFEVVLRNLLAYEAAAKPGGPDVLELAEFVDLMCGIIDTPRDVEILRKEKVIVSDLTDEEIAPIFNGIKRSTGNKETKTTNIEKAVEKVNVEYGNVPKVKAYRLMKKYVYGSWKFLTVFSMVIVVLLLLLQAFCLVYGCSKHWFK
ncbi:hypothetical protein MIMGU_mgv1a026350mg [Erythranthe guttata]|uniref:Uncharacterized protein n=1 Tax=Erythranthe guttata TaxID=4155 RepID=A0A022QFG8_ERYGU|nr:hypothetical protein MIMGU_mgv1a026350mg [Erythranthe guttata]